MKKLKVNDLKVKSFVTASKGKEMAALKGGVTSRPCFISMDNPICYLVVTNSQVRAGETSHRLFLCNPGSTVLGGVAHREAYIGWQERTTV